MNPIEHRDGIPFMLISVGGVFEWRQASEVTTSFAFIERAEPFVITRMEPKLKDGEHLNAMAGGKLEIVRPAALEVAP